ncbi:MAG: exo-alpha-sialidase [Chitinophagaceae bacterium]|nr:MAG: exo-alpha-sialidase [Chitinophagaceae bacterium]
MKKKALLLIFMLFCLYQLYGQQKWLFQTTEVFNATKLHYATTRIPALVVTNKGTLLAFCEARYSSKGDWASIDILMRRSTDGGSTWSKPAVIARRGPIDKPTSNSVPIVDENGTIHFLYQRDYAHCYYIQSTDDGLTWSSPKDITDVFNKFKPEYNWAVLAPGPGHGIQLKNGRLVVPVWLASPNSIISEEKPRPHRPSCVATIYSDDDGETWQRGDIIADNGDIAAGSADTIINPSESVLTQLSDGRVMINIRSESGPHRRLVAYSPDGASHWTKPFFDQALFEPICMASMISLKSPLDKDYLLFCNPDSKDDPASQHLLAREGGRRENLVLKLSDDQGKNWPVEKVVDPGPTSYSDMAVSKDGIIYILYEHLTGFNHPTPQIMLARLNLSWLTNGLN